jgi:hypothetical protein
MAGAAVSSSNLASRSRNPEHTDLPPRVLSTPTSDGASSDRVLTEGIEHPHSIHHPWRIETSIRWNSRLRIRVQISLVKNNKKTKNLVLDLDIWFTGHELAIDFEIMRIWIRSMPG